MLTALDAQSSKFLADVGRIQDRIAKANSQVTSGKRIMVGSDDPDQIGALLQLRSDLQRNTQIQSNLSLAQTDANAADNSLAAAIKLMDTVVSLATQGGNATMDSTARKGIAQQIEAIRQQMVATSQTSVQGRFIFSGDKDDTAAYNWDITQTNPVAQASSSQATRLIEDPSGGAFPVSKTAQGIFDERDSSGVATINNAFNALATLQQALEADNTSGITGSITLIKASTDHLNAMEAFYGNVQIRVENTTDFAGKYSVQLQTEISQKEDTDITSAAMEMVQANTQLQAAFQMRAQMPHSSLFQYLG